MSKIALFALTATAICAALASRGDSLALDDRDGVFSGASRGGSAAMAYQDFWLEPLGSECLHDAEDFLDYTPACTPPIFGVEITPQMLDGLSLNANGTLRLTLGFDGFASGAVTVGAPPLLWGELQGWAAIHRCTGGVQEMCHACGRRHSSDDGYDCSHDWNCAARLAYTNSCTCAPLLVKVNWDDDDGSLSEDRLAAMPCADDEIVEFRAVGAGKACCCHGSISDPVSVAGLTASSGLRLWDGTATASGSTSSFGVEAVAASSGIGSETISYEIRDETNGLLRTITRLVTAANAEIRPDFNDDGTVDNLDRFLHGSATPWQIRVRDEPYKLSLVSEAPSGADASLAELPALGTTPAIRTAATGGVTLLPDVSTNDAAFATASGTKELYVDTSGGPGTVYLHYSLGLGDVHAPLTSVRPIHVVDTSVHEEWATTNSLSDLVYDFSDVLGDIYWTIYDDEDNVVDYGDDSSFTPIDLPPGNYTVEVYFADVYEDGVLGYTSSAALHVVDVRLVRLFETANEANRIFNPTRKDDTTGNPDAETEVVNAGTPLEERYAAPRHYLYTAGDPNTGDFNVSAQFNATGAEGCTNYYCAFYQPNGQKVIGTETNIDFTAEAIAFSLPAPALITNVVWELRGGLDVNNNATLDNDEASPFAIYTNSANIVKYANIKGITGELYDVLHTNLLGNVYVPLDNPPNNIAPNARTLLTLFYGSGDMAMLQDDMRPSLATNILLNAFSSDCDCFAEWLTHNSGAPFSSSGTTFVPHYKWGGNSRLSKFIAKRTPFALKKSMQSGGSYSELPTDTGMRLRTYYESHVRDIAETLLSNAPDGTELVFPTNGWYESQELIPYGIFTSASPSWVPGITVDIGTSDGYSGWLALFTTLTTGTYAFDEYDAFGALGRARIIDPKYRFRVRKNEHILLPTTYDVTAVDFFCIVTDLYDFNYEDGELPKPAAALQIGFGAGNLQKYQDHGRIFAHQITIDTTYDYPFNFLSY